jgi:DNA-binding response OmpR family regulator
MRILLVDDEIELITTLADRLHLRGIEADYAVSGKDALKLAAEKTYDLAVLDMKMAGMSGLETMKQIQRLQPAMKFIILTGHGDEEAYYQGKEAGAAFYLIKPLEIEILIAKINEAVQR